VSSADYLEPGPRSAEATIEILDRDEINSALERSR
jgi:hypothetical protein